MQYSIIEVTTLRHEEEFLLLPVKLYKGVKYWVRPLDNEIRNVFNKDKNPCFRNGECTRWLLYDEQKNCVGRVAAFVNRKTYLLDSNAVGQMGFFECINDKEAAFILFDQCRRWLEERKMDIMEGPVNFGERLEWWGLLVDGFETYPNYAMPYTHPYYVKFFEDYGFQDYFKQFTYRAKLALDSLSPVVVRKADRLLCNPNYRICNYGEIGKDAAVDALLEVYNKAWNIEVHGVEGITRERVEIIYKNLQPILDKELIYFAFYKQQPIGFFLMFPELNQVIRHLNGKLNLLGLIKFFYYKHIRKVNVALGELFGVIPEFQSKGVEAAMIKYFCERIVAKNGPYKYMEMNWVGDFNPSMVHLMEYLGTTRPKTHITYRKMLRDDIPFVRSVDKLTK